MAALRGSGVLKSLQIQGGFGMADVIFLATGVGAFVAFAVLAAALKRV